MRPGFEPKERGPGALVQADLRPTLEGTAPPAAHPRPFDFDAWMAAGGSHAWTAADEREIEEWLDERETMRQQRTDRTGNELSDFAA